MPRDRKPAKTACRHRAVKLQAPVGKIEARRFIVSITGASRLANVRRGAGPIAPSPSARMCVAARFRGPADGCRSGAPGIFPARSPSTSISRSRPARNFFRRAFSCSTVFSRRTSTSHATRSAGAKRGCLARKPRAVWPRRHRGAVRLAQGRHHPLIRKSRFLHPLHASSAGAIFSEFTWSENRSAVFASAIQRNEACGHRGSRRDSLLPTLQYLELQLAAVRWTKLTGTQKTRAVPPAFQRQQ